jgi:branched-chain amino acid aminotransferase
MNEKTKMLTDPRNEHIRIYVGDRLYPREEAKVSVFDSSVQGGDAVWEGLRIYDGRIFQLEAHLSRLHDSAKAMAFKEIPSKETIRQAIFQTLQANGMRDGRVEKARVRQYRHPPDYFFYST